MLALGIVERVNSAYSVKVRIPILHKASTDVNAIPTDSLPDASICTLSKTYPNYLVGSVVVVGFNRNDLSDPIVLGELLTDKESEIETGAKIGSLKVTTNCNLTENTNIGSVNSHDISCLKGTRVNIQSQLDDLQARVEELEREI